MRAKSLSAVRSRLERGQRVAGHFTVQHKATGKRIDVAVLADDDEGTSIRYPPFKQHAKKFWRVIQKDAKARAAAQKLVDAKCDWVYLFVILETYCFCFSSEFQQMERKRNLKLSKLSRKIADFTSRIPQLENKIRDLNREIKELTGIDAQAHSPDFALYDGVLAMAQTETLPSKNDVNIEKALLMYLYHLIANATGRPHLSELADLIQARTSRFVGVDTLQTQLKRAFKERKQLSDQFEKETRDIIKHSPYWLCRPLPSPKQGT